MKSLMMPSIATLRKAIVTNQVQNFLVTDKDCDVAVQIHGKDVASLKGKSTRSHQTPAVDDTVAIPKKLLLIHKNIHLCVDILTVNGIPFLATISKNVMCCTVSVLKDAEHNTLDKELDAVLRKCNNASHRVRHISADDQFQKALDPVKDKLKCTVHCAAAQKHVPEAEQNICTLKDRAQAVHASHACTHLPELFTIVMMLEIATRLNFFVNETGISHCLPRQLLKESKLECHQHCCILIFSLWMPHTKEPHAIFKFSARWIVSTSILFISNMAAIIFTTFQLVNHSQGMAKSLTCPCLNASLTPSMREDKSKMTLLSRSRENIS